MRLPLPAVIIVLSLILSASPTAAQQPARFLIQAGADLTMPVGDLAAVDPGTGGLATSEFGVTGRICAALTERLALSVAWIGHRFGFDEIMYEEFLGEEVEVTTHQARALIAGIRYYVPNAADHRPYVQAGVGRYVYEITGTRDQSPCGHTDDPVPGYTFGGGTILSTGLFAIDLSLDLHTSRFTFIEGTEGTATWLLFSGCLAVPIW